MKFQFITFMLLTLNLLGCTAVHQGDFSKVPAQANKIITNDTVKQLVSLYPPARTRLHLKQSVKDPFGASLIESLRQRGYSLNESAFQGRSTQGMHHLALYYLIDEPSKGTLYRVTLVVGNQSLSRAYKIKKGAITPLGLWVRKE